MMRQVLAEYRIFVIVAAVFFSLVLTASLNAMEPQKPLIKLNFDSREVAKVKEVKRAPAKEAFDMLKDMDSTVDEKLLYKTILAAFGQRKQEIINLALQQIQLPENEIIDGKKVNRTSDLYISKKIFEVFPEESVNRLLSLYENGSIPIKANVIRTLSKIAGGQPVKDLLINALDDKTFIQNDDPDMEGYPLRICDTAYNQLVLRYKIKNVLRTIGTIHKIEDRDYHIAVLKGLL